MPGGFWGRGQIIIGCCGQTSLVGPRRTPTCDTPPAGLRERSVGARVAVRRQYHEMLPVQRPLTAPDLQYAAHRLEYFGGIAILGDTMKQNVHNIERVVRIIAGLSIISLVFIGPQSAWGWLGLIPLATGIVGWCPPYALFGFSTCKKPE